MDPVRAGARVFDGPTIFKQENGVKKPFVTDLSDNAIKSMITLLNARLADAIDLKLAVKQAHWNIRGPGFIALHELFDQIATRVDDHADTMAERLIQLGGHAAGTTQAVAKATTLAPYPVGTHDQAEHVAALSDRLRSFAKSVREAIDEADEAGDADTADIFTGVSRAIDKDLWFVAAHNA
jgi:starvation-inducible DNA-binding protein